LYVVYGLISAGLLQQILLMGVGLFIAYYFAGIISVPTRILIPSIAMFCTVGSFALRNTMFDAYLMFFFGLLGWIMRKHDYPVIAVVLGIILGPIADAELIRTHQLSAGDMTILFTRPISLALIILSVLAVVFPYLARKRRRQ
jgi:putative tricarboxylic transport membrane protein